jgi:hypothetical protein
VMLHGMLLVRIRRADALRAHRFSGCVGREFSCMNHDICGCGLASIFFASVPGAGRRGGPAPRQPLQ